MAQSSHKLVALTSGSNHRWNLRQGVLIWSIHVGDSCIALKNYSTQSLDSSVWAGKNLLKEAVYFLYFLERNAKSHSSLKLKTQASARQGDAYLSLLGEWLGPWSLRQVWAIQWDFISWKQNEWMNEIQAFFKKKKTINSGLTRGQLIALFPRWFFIFKLLNYDISTLAVWMLIKPII